MENKCFIIHNGISMLQTLIKIYAVEIHWDENNKHYHVTFKDTAIKDGCVLIYAFGKGDTIEEAARDYFEQIKNKTLKGTYKEEFKVIW